MEPSISTRGPGRIARLDLDRFDALALAVIIALLGAIGGVIALGDQVGVYVAENGYGPLGVAGGADAIRVRFSDDMAPASVAEHFRIEPDVPGDFSWPTPQLMVFTPRQPFAAGQTYTVTVEQGARAARRGSTLKTSLRWTFSVRLPRVIYLGPADQFARNLYMTDLESGAVYQLTTAEFGVEDFAVSPGGGEIAYSQNNPDGTTDIWVLNLTHYTARQVTNCPDAICRSPSWQPGSTLLAYQREDYNTGLGTGLGPARAWLVDLQTLNTGLLFNDSQILGFAPTWSPTGQRIAVFDATLPGIRVHDYATGQDAIIQSMQGVVGHFSPDGSKLVYPVLVRGLLGAQFYTHLETVDFETNTRTRLSGPEDTPVEDGDGAWSPDGSRMVIARRYLDGRFTMGKQLYLLDTASGTVEPLVVDAEYNHGAVTWDAAGQRIVFQRFSLVAQGARPEIWTYDLGSGVLTQVATNAFLPGWVP